MEVRGAMMPRIIRATLYCLLLVVLGQASYGDRLANHDFESPELRLPKYYVTYQHCNVPIHCVVVDLWHPAVRVFGVTARDAVPRICTPPGKTRGANWELPSGDAGVGRCSSARISETLTEMATRSGAIAAINTDYFSHSNCAPEGMYIHNGEVMTAAQRVIAAFTGRFDHSSTNVYVGMGGVIAPGVSNPSSPPDLDWEEDWCFLASNKYPWIHQAVGGGPVIVFQGEPSLRAPHPDFPWAEDACSADRSDPSGRAGSRSGLGVTRNHRWLILAMADGGGTSSGEGCLWNEFADFFRTLDCWYAIDFDGGGSSSLWFDGELRTSPSDGSARQIGEALIVSLDPLFLDLPRPAGLLGMIDRFTEAKDGRQREVLAVNPAILFQENAAHPHAIESETLSPPPAMFTSTGERIETAGTARLHRACFPRQAIQLSDATAAGVAAFDLVTEWPVPGNYTIGVTIEERSSVLQIAEQRIREHLIENGRNLETLEWTRVEFVDLENRSSAQAILEFKLLLREPAQFYITGMERVLTGLLVINVNSHEIILDTLDQLIGWPEAGCYLGTLDVDGDSLGEIIFADQLGGEMGWEMVIYELQSGRLVELVRVHLGGGC